MKSKSLLSLVSIFAAASFIALSQTGCGKDELAPKNVDIQAKIEELKSSDPNVRADAVVALSEARQNAAPAVPELINLLKDSDAEIRRLTAYTLGEIGAGAAAALPELTKLLKDPDVAVRQQVPHTMFNIDPKSVPEGYQAPANTTGPLP